MSSIHPVALALLNVKLLNGRFLIPTPQANGRYSGTAPSLEREDQFNANLDYRFNPKDWLALKFFFSNTPSTLTLYDGGGGANVPGFGAEQENNNRILSLQELHGFSPRAINEVRLGYNFIRVNRFPQEPVKDSDVGIRRSNASAFPGLPQISIAPNAGGLIIGTATGAINSQATVPSVTVADMLSITRDRLSLRAGAEVRYYQSNLARTFQNPGSINFLNFRDFLVGATNIASLGSGITTRSLRATDYGFFVQDDWKVSSQLTLNLGLRYELNLPPYDTRGRLSTFDPTLYKPRLEVDARGPIGPPIGGFVQAGNVIAQYDLPEIPNVGKRVLRSIDANNFAPRVGFAYSPSYSSRLALRGGYGFFYSRASSVHLANSANAPPFYVVARRSSAAFDDPFPAVPSSDQFPIVLEGIALSTQVFDRNIRTPYIQQYNASLQFAPDPDLLLEVAYVGTRGINLQRMISLNQARLVSPQYPITNEVAGQLIATNTGDNAQLRAPFQGVAINGFLQNQYTAQSTYNSLQMSLTRRLSQGLQFLAAYTHAKSLDNASGGNAGGGNVGDTSIILGNQLDNRANRGVSDFDRTHRFVLGYLWDLPHPTFAAPSPSGRWLLSGWQIAGIFVAMSGLPIDIVDSGAGSFFGFANGTNTLTRPNFAPGATRRSAMSDIPAGYFFNPAAFARPVVLASQPIPSSNSAALAGARGTDIGSVGRNILRGPKQINVDFSLIKRLRLTEARNIEFRVEFFNVLNHANLANPLSNFNAIPSAGVDPSTGHVISPGDFGRILSTSGNPRLLQFVLRFFF